MVAGAEGYRLFLIDQARSTGMTEIAMERHLESQSEPEVMATSAILPGALIR